MRILELKNLFREEGYIYYRRNFSGEAVIEVPGTTLYAPIDFCIETDPLGVRSIELSVASNVNYPLLPLKKALAAYILEEDKEGRLP